MGVSPSSTVSWCRPWSVDALVYETLDSRWKESGGCKGVEDPSFSLNCPHSTHRTKTSFRLCVRTRGGRDSLVSCPHRHRTCRPLSNLTTIVSGLHEVHNVSPGV